MSERILELKRRLEKNLAKREKLMKAWPTTAVRLYDKDLPNFPYLIDYFTSVRDRYALIQFKGKKRFPDDDDKEKEIVTLLETWLEIPAKHIHLKERRPQGPENQYKKLDNEGSSIFIEEGRALFRLNLTDYMDTGLFLDHRPLRKWIGKDCEAFVKKEGKTPKFLNLFCYTASVSVMAALAGASTVNLDLSSTYLDWAQGNFELNEISLKKHQFIKAPIQEMDEHIRGSFDFIYLDPPTFSNSKRTSDFDIQEDHLKLILQMKKYLSPKGVLWFSCNRRDFVLDPKVGEHFHIQNKSHDSIPEDFTDEKIHQCYRLLLKD